MSADLPDLASAILTDLAAGTWPLSPTIPEVETYDPTAEAISLAEGPRIDVVPIDRNHEGVVTRASHKVACVLQIAIRQRTRDVDTIRGLLELHQSLADHYAAQPAIALGWQGPEVQALPYDPAVLRERGIFVGLLQLTFTRQVPR